MLGLILFIAGSFVALYMTWVTIRAGFKHWLTRLFAFEAILGLVALNLKFWFDDPFTPRQVLSWVLLILSGFLVVHGFLLLDRAGKSQGEFEHTTVLVTSGAYRYIRHPLYASLLYLGLGVFLKHISLLAGALALLTIACLYITARVEEGENIERFGDAYREYMQYTKMFVPFLF